MENNIDECIRLCNNRYDYKDFIKLSEKTNVKLSVINRHLEKKTIRTIYTQILKKNVDNFKFIPKEDRDIKLSIKAVSGNIKNMKYVPDRAKSICFGDHFYCKLKNEDEIYKVIKYLPTSKLNFSLCIKAVKYNPKSMKYVPEHIQSMIEGVEKNKD